MLSFSSCITALLTGSFEPIRNRLDKLELGMTKAEVTKILNAYYTVVEKSMNDGEITEVLSYSFGSTTEVYLFVLVDNKLVRWFREFIPRYEIKSS